MRIFALERKHNNCMQIVTFYSPKGGVGKTTFNIMLASYLRYVLHKKVLFLDFDAPNFNACLIREKEIDAAENKDALYPIDKVDGQHKEKILNIVKNLYALKDSTEYVIVDFRGSLSQEDAILIFAQYGVLDKVIIPIEMDNQVLSSANALATIFSSMGQKVLLFFNRVFHQENKMIYDEARRMFAEHGHTISNSIVYNTVKLRRDVGVNDNLRSSIMFPSKDKLGKNVGIINLFNEIIDENKR